MRTIVYKLGGSLLTLPDLGRRVSHVLAAPLPSDNLKGHAVRALIVVGGGEVADVVRRWDQLHHIGDEVAHDLALRSMSLNARLLAALLPNAEIVASRHEADAVWSEGASAILLAAEFLQAEEQTQKTLPHSWSVTSDSIAAAVASWWPADGLVLLKSISLPPDCTSETLSRLEYVDAAFPRWAQHVPFIGWANLRSDDPAVSCWSRK